MTQYCNRAHPVALGGVAFGSLLGASSPSIGLGRFPQVNVVKANAFLNGRLRS